MTETKLKKNDFIEIEFIGKIKDTNQVFDTNIKKEAKKINADSETKPLVICLGQNMLLPAIDKFLIGKDLGECKLELKPEQAFGKRNRELIKIMPISVFKKQNINPQVGMVFTFDNAFGRISVVSGGRVIVDFNNPIAGKEVVYEIKVKRKILDEKEKIKALMLFFFKKEFPFHIEGKKLIVKVEKRLGKFLDIFKEKFKEILGLDLQVKEIEEEVEEEKKEKK